MSLFFIDNEFREIVAMKFCHSLNMHFAIARNKGVENSKKSRKSLEVFLHSY